MLTPIKPGTRRWVFRFHRTTFRKSLCAVCRACIPSGEEQAHAQWHLSLHPTGAGYDRQPGTHRAFRDIVFALTMREEKVVVEDTGWVTESTGPR